MKAHEAWYKEYTARVEPQIDYLDTQVSWRAALKWVLRHDPDIGIASCIRKELEDEN